MKDYYNILGVDASASEDQIRQAYKRLAMQHHPDRGGDAARFQEIQEAYSTLTDPNRRAQWEQQQAFQDNAGNFSFQFNFGPDINDIFRGFHGPFGHFRQQQKNRDLRTTIVLDMASTLDAQIKHVNIKHQDGSTNTVQINIPRGVQTNMQMRFPGYGDNSNKTVPPGDLYVDFKINPAQGFSQNGINLHKKCMINCIDAMLGHSVSITGLDGRTFDLNIPRGTQPGTQFRIPNNGLWDINHPVRGDLFVEIMVEVPNVISQEQFQRLNSLVS
jgi:curved DNA-binding protein